MEEMNPVIPVYKHVGETSLQAIERFRACYPKELTGKKLSYAGRLDPMAEGLLIVLVGEVNKGRERYLGLDKEYLIEGVLGFTSDTYDLMGIIKGGNDRGIKSVDEEQINEFLRKSIGKTTQKYPAYSVKGVQGKPLWLWAREGRLDEIERPEKEVEIYSAELEKFASVEKTELVKIIHSRINRVSGDFRQSEALASWKEVLGSTPETIPFFRIRVSCASGTYMRVLVNDLGEALGTGALVLRITRTKVGDYKLR